MSDHSSDDYSDLFDIDSDPVEYILERLGLGPTRMANQVVLIAGGARGIAAQAARGLAHLGAIVVVVDQRMEGQKLVDEIGAQGGQAHFHHMNLAVDAEIERLCLWIERTLGRVDVLIHNAVHFEVSALTEVSVAEWDHANDTNVRSAFILISRFLPGMLERSHGTVVTMIAPGGLAYASAMSASKSALRSLTQSLAAEVGSDTGVSIMGFAPGLVATAMVREVFPRYCQRLGMSFRDFVRRFTHNPGYKGMMPVEHCGASLVHAVVNNECHHGLIADAVRPLQSAGLIQRPTKIPVDDPDAPDNSVRLLEHISEIQWMNDTIEEHIKRRVERLESDLAREQQSSYHSQRVAAVGILAAGVAHEINNPLTYVLGNLDFLGETLQENAASMNGAVVSEMEELLAETTQGIGRIRTIVRELRLFSRVDENAPRTEVNVKDLLGSAVRIVANQIIHRARLVKDFQETPIVLADEGKLCQVAVNLLVNAAHSIPIGNADQDEIRICTRTDNQGRAVIEIHDTGCGISPDHLTRIFDPFFTTKSREQGTGLGLSVCQGIVVAMGGEIQVASEVGQGSTFRVLLPGAVMEDKIIPFNPVARSTVRPLKVLVIDDDPGVAKTLQRYLWREEVEVCFSGREGLARLTQGWHHDIVFCDLMMPDLSGMDLFEEVKRLKPEFSERFIFITGGAFSLAARSFLELGQMACVFKPFDAQDISEAIAAVLTNTAPALVSQHR